MVPYRNNPMGSHGAHYNGLGVTGKEVAGTTALLGLVVGGYIVDGLLTNYMVGGNFSKKDIARRSAIVGVLLGVPTYVILSNPPN